MQLFDWPPQAACGDVRERNTSRWLLVLRFVFAFSDVAASACAARRQSNSLQLFVIFAARCHQTSFVFVSSFLL
jgi:hypothetical protein